MGYLQGCHGRASLPPRSLLGGLGGANLPAGSWVPRCKRMVQQNTHRRDTKGPCNLEIVTTLTSMCGIQEVYRDLEIELCFFQIDPQEHLH